MTDDNRLSQMETKSIEILKGHNGVYLDKKLYSALKKEFPNITRKEFQDVLDSITSNGYSMERGLIRPLTAKESEKQLKEKSDKKSGKGASDRPRLSTKRGI